MIYNFEKYTYSLSPMEYDETMPAIGEILNKLKPGQYRTNGDIITSLKYHYGISNVTPDRVRVMIHILRVTDQVPLLLASQKGYHKSLDCEQILKYADSLKERIDRIERVREAICRQVEVLTKQEIIELI